MVAIFVLLFLGAIPEGTCFGFHVVRQRNSSNELFFDNNSWRTTTRQKPTTTTTTSSRTTTMMISKPITPTIATTTATTHTCLHCICIHCKYVTNCEAYHFVETKHEQPHISSNPTFTPRDGSPTIHVNIRTFRSNSDEEVARIWSEHEMKQALAEEAASQKGTDVEQEVVKSDYDLSVQTTYEYDVVKCADFIEEKDAWVNNMPDEIRERNPHFVPT